MCSFYIHAHSFRRIVSPPLQSPLSIILTLSPSYHQPKFFSNWHPGGHLKPSVGIPKIFLIQPGELPHIPQTGETAFLNLLSKHFNPAYSDNCPRVEQLKLKLNTTPYSLLTINFSLVLALDALTPFSSIHSDPTHFGFLLGDLFFLFLRLEPSPLLVILLLLVRRSSSLIQWMALCLPLFPLFFHPLSPLNIAWLIFRPLLRIGCLPARH
jgi:hypothetical protein